MKGKKDFSIVLTNLLNLSVFRVKKGSRAKNCCFMFTAAAAQGAGGQENSATRVYGTVCLFKRKGNENRHFSPPNRKCVSVL